MRFDSGPHNRVVLQEGSFHSGGTTLPPLCATFDIGKQECNSTRWCGAHAGFPQLARSVHHTHGKGKSTATSHTAELILETQKERRLYNSRPQLAAYRAQP